MSIVNGIIVNNVGWGDISTALSVPGPPYDIGYCIEHGIINKWAKYKPLASNKIGFLTETERAEMAQGMTVGKFTSPASLYASFTTQWAYTRPSAAQGHKFRSHDFVQVTNTGAIVQTSAGGTGYNPNAEVPIQGWFNPPPTEYYLTTLSELLVSFGLKDSSQTTAGSVKLSDVTPEAVSFGNMYLGVMLFSSETRTGTRTYRGLQTYIETGVQPQTTNISYCEANHRQLIDIKFPDSVFSVPSGASSRFYHFMPVIVSGYAATLDTASSKYSGGIFAVPNADIIITEVKPAVGNLIVFHVTTAEFYYERARLYASFTLEFWATQMSRGVEFYYEIYAGDSAMGITIGSGSLWSGNATTTHQTTSFSRQYNVSPPDYVTLVITEMQTHQVETSSYPVTNDDLL